MWSEVPGSKKIHYVFFPFQNKNQTRPSSSMPDFREDFSKAKHIVVLTGAGVSAESGVPTFRGAGGYWRKWQAQVRLKE